MYMIRLEQCRFQFITRIMLAFAGNDEREFSLNVSLDLSKIVLEGNTGDQKRLRVFSFSLNV